MTTNSLIHAILIKYLNWDRFAERYGFMSLSQEGMLKIIQNLSEKDLIEAATQNGSQVPKDILIFWYGRSDLAGFLKYVTLLSDNARLAEFEIARDGTKHIKTPHHDLGIKWSSNIAHFLKSSLKHTLDIESEVQLSTNSVALTFDANSEQKVRIDDLKVASPAAVM